MNNLRELRVQLGWQQVRLAVAVGCSPSTIVNIEKFGYPTTAERRQRIADALGVDIDAIWPSEEPAVA